MNLRCILGLLAAGCLSGLSLRADVAPTDNPYTPIVARNMFGLVPVPTNAPIDPASLVPPPKITPNGIMTIFGRLQVLFKVAGEAKPGVPAKDESYVLCEGDRQDDIEVEKIDEKAAIITFNNHGVVQELPLVAASATPGGGAAPAAGPAGFGRPPGPGVPPPGAGMQHLGFGGRFGRSQNSPPPSAPAPSVAAPSVAAPSVAAPSIASPSGLGGATASTPAATAEPPMPVEQQIIMIEAQRMNYLQQGDPTAAIMPPTEMTPEVTGESGSGGTPEPEPEPARGK